MGTSGTTLCSEVVQTPRVSQAQGRHPATSPASLLCCSPHLQPCPCRRTHTPIPPGCVPGGLRRLGPRPSLLPPPYFGLGPRQGEAALGTSSEQRGPATSLCSSPHLLRPADMLLPQKRPPRTTLSRADKPERFPMKNYEPVRLFTLSCRSHYPAPNQTPSSPKVGTRPSCLPPLCPPSNSRGLGTEWEIRIQGMTGSMSRGKPRIVTQTCLQIFCL